LGRLAHIDECDLRHRQIRPNGPSEVQADVPITRIGVPRIVVERIAERIGPRRAETTPEGDTDISLDGFVTTHRCRNLLAIEVPVAAMGDDWSHGMAVLAVVAPVIATVGFAVSHPIVFLAVVGGMIVIPILIGRGVGLLMD
jgi:hypothetical protein